MATLPRVVVLKAFTDFLRSQVAALPPGERFTVRHRRNRETHPEEYPCLTVRMVSDDPGNITGTDATLSLAEQVCQLSVDLIAETELPPEVDDGEGGAPGDDPTGLETPGALIAAVLGFLFTTGEDPENLGGVVWDIRHDGSGDDDEGTPDAARVVERLTLLYRVRADNPLELLI